MNPLKRYTVLGIIFVWAGGTLAHFLYDWTGRNSLVGLFAPVNESIWEHMKLLFFPMLLYALFLCCRFRTDYPCLASSLCFGIVAGTLLIPALYYAYRYVLGRDIFILDIGIFILSTAAAFLLSYSLTRSCRAKPWGPLLYGMVLILFVCFLRFTCHPPALKIFEDPSRANSQENESPPF